MKEFFFGFIYPLKSFSFFLKNPKLILYSMVPILINILIYGTIFILSFSWFIDFLNNIKNSRDSDALWLQEFFYVVVLVVTFIALLIVCYLAFVIFGSIITAPFNEKISRYMEEHITKTRVEYNVRFWKDAWLSIKAELLKIAFYLSILIPIFLLNLLPVIGSILSATLGVVFSFYFNALDFLDYPMTRKFFTLRKKIKVVSSKKMLSLGFGCCAFLLMFLPIVNVFLKPVCVSAGTLYILKKVTL